MTTNEVTKSEATTTQTPAGYMRVDGVLQMLPISRRTLERWKKQGRLPIIRAGERLILYRRSDIEKMLEKMTVRAV